MYILQTCLMRLIYFNVKFENDKANALHPAVYVTNNCETIMAYKEVLNKNLKTWPCVLYIYNPSSTRIHSRDVTQD